MNKYTDGRTENVWRHITNVTIAWTSQGPIDKKQIFFNNNLSTSLPIFKIYTVINPSHFWTFLANVRVDFVRNIDVSDTSPRSSHYGRYRIQRGLWVHFGIKSPYVLGTNRCVSFLVPIAQPKSCHLMQPCIILGFVKSKRQTVQWRPRAGYNSIQ